MQRSAWLGLINTAITVASGISSRSRPSRFVSIWLVTKVTVGIVPSENAEVEELRAWKVDDGEIRADPRIAREISEFIEERQVLSVAITDGIIGCPHQEGIDYEGEWCPFCEFWHGRDRFTGQAIN